MDVSEGGYTRLETPSAGLPGALTNSQKTPLKGESGTGSGDRSPSVGDAGG